MTLPLGAQLLQGGHPGGARGGGGNIVRARSPHWPSPCSHGRNGGGPPHPLSEPEPPAIWNDHEPPGAVNPEQGLEHARSESGLWGQLSLDSTPGSTVSSLCDLGQVSNLSGSNIIPLIYCRPMFYRGSEFSVHSELLSFCPHPITASVRQGELPLIAFGGRSAIFLGGGSLACSAPGFLSGFPARVSHPSDSTLVVSRKPAWNPGLQSRRPYSAQGPIGYLS